MKEIPEKYLEGSENASYSPTVCFSGELVITSGQCCDDYEAFDGTISDDIETQTRQAIQACREKLEASGSSLDKVIFVEVSITDMADWPRFNAVYKELMPVPRPARKTVQVGLLPGYKVELVMLATR